MTIPAITGTVIHGTLRPQDLAPAFLATLEALAPAHPGLAGWREDVAYVVDEQYSDAIDYYMRADETVIELGDAIDEVLPEGWRFGVTEGDASDYGVWQYDEDDLF